MAYINGKQILNVEVAGLVNIDDAMSDESTNPVQNKVAKQYVDNLCGFKTICAGALDATTGGVAAIKAEITEDISKFREFNLCIEFKATAEMDGKTAYLNANISGSTLNNCIYTTTSDALKSNNAYKSISHINVIKKTDGFMAQGVHTKMSSNMGVNSRGNAVGSMSPWEITEGATLYLNISISGTTFPSGTKWVLEGR